MTMKARTQNSPLPPVFPKAVRSFAGWYNALLASGLQDE
jgi:hypothetical protein